MYKSKYNDLYLAQLTPGQYQLSEAQVNLAE